MSFLSRYQALVETDAIEHDAAQEEAARAFVRATQARVDLVPILRQVVDGLQMLARDRETAVVIEAPSPLMVAGDRDELLRLFENLVENAIKYAASGRRVDIRAGTGAGADGALEAQVTVQDYGPGIAPDHLPRLTERFYRVDEARSRGAGGTGLGLAIVKHIVERHRGTLDIRSRPGEGTTVTISLPPA